VGGTGDGRGCHDDDDDDDNDDDDDGDDGVRFDQCIPLSARVGAALAVDPAQHALRAVRAPCGVDFVDLASHLRPRARVAAVRGGGVVGVREAVAVARQVGLLLHDGGCGVSDQYGVRDAACPLSTRGVHDGGCGRPRATQRGRSSAAPVRGRRMRRDVGRVGARHLRRLRVALQGRSPPPLLLPLPVSLLYTHPPPLSTVAPTRVPTAHSLP
jgi:hypothetical protein